MKRPSCTAHLAHIALQANNGADPNRRNNLRQTPFHIARTLDDTTCADMITVLEQASIVRFFSMNAWQRVILRHSSPRLVLAA